MISFLVLLIRFLAGKDGVTVAVAVEVDAAAEVEASVGGVVSVGVVASDSGGVGGD